MLVPFSLAMGVVIDWAVVNMFSQADQGGGGCNHAKTLLNPGGLLVALCYNGVKQNKHLRPIADTWEVLPEQSFRSEGTFASVALLTIRA